MAHATRIEEMTIHTQILIETLEGTNCLGGMSKQGINVDSKEIGYRVE